MPPPPAPRVSVVVPAFNNAEFVGATLASILEQSFTDFELIVSDHSSTDATWARLQDATADPRVSLMILPPGGGAPANWRAVTAAARGELVKLVCADDLLYPDALARQVAAFDAHPEAVLVAGQRDLIDQHGRVVLRARGLQGLDGVVAGRDAIRRTVRAGTNVFGEPGGVLFRRTTLLESGGWDAREPYLLDQATCARVLLHGPMVAIRSPLAAFRINPGQWSVALARSQAAHARSFHHTLRAEHPEVLGDVDVRVGDVRATAMAVVRRASYLWLHRRSASTRNRAH